ncbi:hypothetical protein [Hyphomonas pacifica]|uniref:Uncharacterized protein n=1 Tax=Hyphomonas pacifica TaxID=1280941 RepID=A0A062U325_9PROT|nr:hypothetical protein [Hyphomonas pacifica]KCZ52143.1 hypothetical protein HY2_09890 [Hyphomonas pacifica]RAN32253.1 hypothetical protein HY3_02705 [Hyphomonas pacifica]
MRLTHKHASAAIFGSLLILAACDSNAPERADVPADPVLMDHPAETDAELTDFQKEVLSAMQQAAESGQTDSAFILAVFEAREDARDLFLDTAETAYADGKTPYEAGRAGGEAIRPIIIEESNRAVTRATDQQAADLITITGKEFREFQTSAPQDCARAAAGLSPRTDSPRMKQLRQEESAVTLAILQAPDQTGGTVTPMDDILTWMGAVFTDQPDAATGAAYIGTPNPTDEQARQVCHTMIVIYDELGKLPLAQRAAYMRGLSAG